MKIASKSPKRNSIINEIANTLTSKDITDVLSEDKPETIYKHFMYRPLLDTIERLYIEHKICLPEKAREKAKDDLIAEIDKGKTLHLFKFLGTNHRPDFVLELDDITIAVEIKLGKVGDSGASIREGIGQGIVYTTHYDFCILIFVDSTKKDIKNNIGDRERELIDELWENHNIQFRVV